MDASISCATATTIVPYTPERHPSAQPRADMERIQNLFIERSFKAQFRDYNYFHQHAMGDIIILVGTSTAGKTSIIKALIDLEPDRIEDGGDLRGLNIDLELIRKHCPDQLAWLEGIMEPLDISKAVFTPTRFWKGDPSEADKAHANELFQQIRDTIHSLPRDEVDAAFKDIDLKMYDAIFERSRQGIRTIFDDVQVIDTFARHALMRGFNGPIRATLVYCPFHVLSARMERRTREAEASGDFTNRRVGEFPLRQFSEIYTKKLADAETLETITREQAIAAFDTNFDKGTVDARAIGIPLPPEDELELAKTTQRRQFLTNLGFEEDTLEVDVSPRSFDQYDFLINSHELSPRQSAQILHEQTQLTRKS